MQRNRRDWLGWYHVPATAAAVHRSPAWKILSRADSYHECADLLDHERLRLGLPKSSWQMPLREGMTPWEQSGCPTGHRMGVGLEPASMTARQTLLWERMPAGVWLNSFALAELIDPGGKGRTLREGGGALRLARQLLHMGKPLEVRGNGGRGTPKEYRRRES